ncbi:MAG TPA: hypothetical protein VFQ53_11975 [Kofleriaceae bacterium]|nr:hypothetical protein [Kofleriaceae bacterium]
MRLAGLLLPLSLIPISSTALALPPGAEQRGFVDGANHHVGDASFVAAFGRAPDARDAEPMRMHAHLAYIRAQLAAKPATRPELAARRAEILGYLDDYIAKGITPVNTHLPWRTPVFIDDYGNVCAVGYLIERSVGRALPEQIATHHRYDFLEDIAASMPEVRAWVEASGFTLEELASIQPGYEEPEVESWDRWDLVAMKVPDGPYTDEVANGRTMGRFEHRKMEGEWRRMIGDVVVGRGTLHRGAGAWTSYYRTGQKLAEGRYANNDPTGEWTFYHPSGNVAARGSLRRGERHGLWTFYQDTAQPTPIARGRFVNGSLAGTWRHFDTDGKLLATYRPTNSVYNRSWDGGYLLTVEPGADRVQHEIHSFGGVDSHRMEAFYDGDERIYVYDDQHTYDANGNLLVEHGGEWTASACTWSAKRKRIARSGDLTSMHGLLLYVDRDGDITCADPTPVPAARADHLDRMLASMRAVRSATPKFIRELALRGSIDDAMAADNDQPEAIAELLSDDDPKDRDLVRLLAANMTWYTEWPHIDGRFIEVFDTLPGSAPKWSWQDKIYAAEATE